MVSLKDALNEKTVKLKASVSDWKEAITIGCQMLVDTGSVESRYIDSIISFTEEYGPYYVIAPGLAMPHSRPEDGVLKTSFSLLTLEKAVEFGSSNDPIDILLFLSAIDNESHLKALKEVVTLFSNPHNLDRVRNARHYLEILDLLDNKSLDD